eukprot:CCRYP_002000-RA/>CCRYP_002000-RA protein AED:0.00 eAED:0.00 QI:95/1/1/1/1/1/2/78/364
MHITKLKISDDEKRTKFRAKSESNEAPGRTSYSGRWDTLTHLNLELPGQFPVTESTRRVLVNMDNEQISRARKAFETLKQQRRVSRQFSTLRASSSGHDDGIDAVSSMENKSKKLTSSESQTSVFCSNHGVCVLDGSDPLDRVVNRLNDEDRLFTRHSKVLVFKGESVPNSKVREQRRGRAQSLRIFPSGKQAPRMEQDSITSHYNGKKDERRRPSPCPGMWDVVKNSFIHSLSLEGQSKNNLAKPLIPVCEPNKKISGARYFRKGKSKAAKGLFLDAVALYNFALMRQREDLGEDHSDCGATLNEIGLAWMMLGERFSALTAFEEALYIRQKSFGDGAKEVAETTNNIWMVLHEQRLELENGS